uniref:Endonuclease/exonuclease/phosphatase domain-containing protein n=1 Tax=Paramoeba aestuarina TaxID=180227 RepID=A0A6U2VU72_9EUKA|mmetsp:Transcript_11980/g.18231  ORF Transcript_11980/g.18231 Transcript_11980/m.18231 type:complete len:386 (+) Transcript_11980:307-1464(+)
MSDIGAGEESEGGWGEISGEMVVFGRKVAIMLRGECLKMWREGGRKWGRGERWVWVEVGGERWIGVYAPHSGKKKKIRKEFWEEIEEVIEGAGEKMIWVGGDLNAQVGRGEREEGKWVRGKWGMEETSRSGKELVEWCWKIGMGVVTTFVCQSGSGRKEKIGRRRGTWWDVMRKEGKEIDGWLVNRVNIRLVKGCKTWGVGLGGGEETDHWPKEVRIGWREGERGGWWGGEERRGKRGRKERERERRRRERGEEGEQCPENQERERREKKKRKERREREGREVQEGRREGRVEIGAGGRRWYTESELRRRREERGGGNQRERREERREERRREGKEREEKRRRKKRIPKNWRKQDKSFYKSIIQHNRQKSNGSILRMILCLFPGR